MGKGREVEMRGILLIEVLQVGEKPPITCRRILGSFHQGSIMVNTEVNFCRTLQLQILLFQKKCTLYERLKSFHMVLGDSVMRLSA